MVKLRKMRSTDDEEESVASAATPTSARPSWMNTQKEHATEWLETLPEVSFSSVVECKY